MTPASQNTDWQTRLAVEIEKLQANANREVSLERLFARTAPPSRSDLMRAISSLIAEGELVPYYILLSPSRRQEIERFRSLAEIPKTEVDVSTGEEFSPNPFKDIELVYVSPEAAR